MIAGDLIRHAQASGIELRLVGGKVKAIGPREAVARLIEPLRQHREALTLALQFELREVPATTPVDAVPEPTDWHTLDAAYLAHHFRSQTTRQISHEIHHLLQTKGSGNQAEYIL